MLTLRAPVAQLDRAMASGAMCRTFESCQAHMKATISIVAFFMPAAHTGTPIPTAGSFLAPQKSIRKN